MSIGEQLAQWRHESAWLWLRYLLGVEYSREFARAALRQAKLPPPSFKIRDIELQRLLGLK